MPRDLGQVMAPLSQSGTNLQESLREYFVGRLTGTLLNSMANGQADQAVSLSLRGFEQSVSIRSDRYGKVMEGNLF